MMKRFYCSSAFKRKRNGAKGSAAVDERRLSEKCHHCKKKTKKTEIHFFSLQHHHSPHFLSFPLLPPLTRKHGVKVVANQYRKKIFCRKVCVCMCVKISSRCVVISRDCSSTIGVSCTSPCFAELLRNVCASVGF